MSKRIRCAIYTRKSTEEGLEQDFNSLDAQREACEAYIQSQRGQGWVIQRKRYDDAGISGGTMHRPALQDLLADIGKGEVDLVVVYNVDRLTRSLTDFARIIETFRCPRCLLRLRHPAVQHRQLDGAPDVARAALLCPVRT